MFEFATFMIITLVGMLTCPDPNALKPDRVDAILARLNETSKDLKTYQAKVVYINEQPILETKALRTGTLFFKGDGRSKMRVSFTTLKQDNEPVAPTREEYVFDGVDMTRINYDLKSVEIRQLSEPNHPLDAFELASRYWPIIGFAKVDELKKDFDVSLVSDTNTVVQLRLKSLPSSRYAQDYAFIDFWIDTGSYLPLRMSAQSPDDIISDFKLEDAVVNKKMNDDVFDIEVPENFGKNIIPLEK
ncbi:MAG: hypothetical protein A2Y07_02185 [Planctomycetes bacterium GWF2_50_10]|nr:MAG: hypothetical protein A2Y07_02185 [Planctomycetes bacterium GWF2_50_10]